MPSQSALPGGSPEPIRILHVDDEPDFTALAATYIQREDDRFTVDTEHTASDGLDRLADERFDCIISDYNMPGRNGIEFLEAVRDDHPELPFILFTGRGSEEVASEAISTGVTDYLQKDSGTEQYAILSNRVRNAVERRRVDRERERMRERMALALDVTDSVLFEIDPETGEIRSHGSMGAVFGEPAGDGTNRADFVERAVHPEDRDRLDHLFGRLQRGESEYDVIDYRTNPAVGEQRWMRGHAYYEGNDEPRIVGFATDVTEQKTRERRLRELNERFEHLAEAVPAGLFIVAPDYSETLYVNGAAKELYGIDGEDVAADPSAWQRHVHPADLDRLRADIETQRTGDVDGPQHQEFRIQHPERGTRWLDVDLYPIREDDDLERLAGVATDVTERREREMELTRYERIVEELDDVVAILAPDGTIRDVNPAVGRTLGYEPEALVGEVAFPDQPPSTDDALSAALGDVVEQPDESRTIRAELRRKDGSVCRVEATLRNRIDDEIDGILVIIRELAEQREPPAQLQHRNERPEGSARAVGHGRLNPLDVTAGGLELAREGWCSRSGSPNRSASRAV
jgi:PAS domain S-box-containing protein